MAKKKTKKKAKAKSKLSKVPQFMKKVEVVWERYSPVVVDFLERESVHIMTWMSKIAGIKKYMKKIFAAYSLMLAGILILVMGLAVFFDSLVAWPPGIMYMLTGVIVLIIAAIVAKS